MSSLLLDSTWDLMVDANGNIAVCDSPYALAQDAATAIRLFLGELYYDTSKGVPYFDQILGHATPLNLLKARFEAAALTVPGVVAAQCFISSIQGRKVSGQVTVTDSLGQTQTAVF